MLRPALIIHGGAGAAAPELAAAQRAGCSAALAAGWQGLAAGGTALDAVCAAVAVLEDDPAFNAGTGSCLTSRGTVEMDAAVMDGCHLRAGAVAVVRAVRHPVWLARALMEAGPQVFLVGPEAEAFAEEHGVERCRPEDLITERQLRRWHQRAASTHATVGAAAVDRNGQVAAATSTGGIAGKRPGRVGDTAVIGAGTYADATLGAASATGDGEGIIRVVLSKLVVDALAAGGDPMEAARRGVARLQERVGTSAGLIVVDTLGRFGYANNTPHLTLGYMRPDLPSAVVSV